MDGDHGIKIEWRIVNTESLCTVDDVYEICRIRKTVDNIVDITTYK